MLISGRYYQGIFTRFCSLWDAKTRGAVEECFCEIVLIFLFVAVI